MTDKDKHMTDNNYIFVHIPKTAGRSILTALGLKLNNQHKTLADYTKELGEPVVRSRFKFTTVRNPWDRAVSWWLFFGHMGSPQGTKPFEQWVVAQANRHAKMPKPITQRFPLDQFSFCRLPSGEVLMDHFIRFENLDADFEPVAKRFGISTPLPKIGQRDKQMRIQMAQAMARQRKTDPENLEPIIADYHAAYKTQQSIDAVAKMESELIAKFGYDFKR
jgi:hypothetical protein